MAGITNIHHPSVGRPSIQQAFSRVLHNIKQLPSPPEVCLAITQAVQNESTSLEDMQRLVENDIALSARLIQVANSAFFGIRERVTSVRRAISLLGFSTVRTLALGFFFNEEFGKLRLEGLPYPDLPRFALTSSAIAEAIAQRVMPEAAHEAACLGLLHETGVIVMAMSFGSQYRQAVTELADSRRPLCEMELEAFGLDHATAGQLLMTSWRFSGPFVHAVTYHHQEVLPDGNDPHAVLLWNALSVAHRAALLFFTADDPEAVDQVARCARNRLGWDAYRLGELLRDVVPMYDGRVGIFNPSEEDIAAECQRAMRAATRLMAGGRDATPVG